MSISKYFTPTKVYFGKGAELETGKALKEAGFKKVLVHYGTGSVIKSGLLAKVEKTLTDNDISFVELGGVVPNPRLSLVRKGIEIGKKEKIDLILVVGGGSALDSAKAIGCGIEYDGDVWDFYCGKKVLEKCTPTAVVLTLSATGSEMSNSSVITNDEKTPNDKVGQNSDYIRPAFAFLNPELTYTVSKYQTGSGSVDIMMHTLERYFHQGETFEFTDRNSATLLKTVYENAIKALENPCDYDARANLMWCGSVSHNGFLALGNPTIGDWACHRLEHELSALFDVAHGAGLSAIWGSWARYVAHNNFNRFAWLGKELFGIEEKDPQKATELTIQGFEKWFTNLGMPTGLHQLGLNLDEEGIEKLTLKASINKTRTLGDFMKLQHNDMLEIYKAANRN